MKKALFVILLLCYYASNVFAQKQENVWVFGYLVGMDFNSGSPVPILANNGGYTGTASVCDASGQLLFSTNGWTILDRTSNLMPGGTSLAPVWLTQAQPALIVPMPDSGGKYYIFSLGLGTNRLGNANSWLYYSIVDMNLNGGLGDVVHGRNGILIDSNLTDKMTAVLGSSCDVWVLVHKRDTAAFKAYEINGNGLNLHPVVSNTTLSSIYHHQYVGGVMKVSHDGRKIVLCNQWDETLELFDFNPGTGVVSNHIKMDGDYYGAAFSPDNRLLYVSSFISFLFKTTSIYQFDLDAGSPAAIANSRTTICVLDSDNTKPAFFTDLKLGPDGHIYFGEADYVHMGAIKFPNLVGAACTYTPSVVSFTGLPRADASTFPACGLPNEIVMFKRDTLFDKQNIKLCFKDSLVIMRDTGGVDYLWDNGLNNYARTVYNSGKYWVDYITPPCTHHYDTFFVQFSGRTPITNSASGCSHAAHGMAWSQPPAGDTTTYTYTWSDAAGTIIKRSVVNIKGDTVYGVSGIYYLDIRAPYNGCDTTIRFDVPLASVSFTEDTAGCVNSDIHFTNISTGNYTSFVWNFGDGDTASSVTSAIHVYTQPGIYKVILTAYPCGDTAEAILKIDSLPFVQFIANSQSVCLGQQVNFYPSYRSGTKQLIWNFENDIGISSWQPSHTYDSIGEKIVTVTAKYLHCPDTIFRDTINVYPYPVVNLGPDTSICPGHDGISIRDLMLQPVNYASVWNTGETGNVININTPDVYWLKVTSDKGCSTSDSLQVYNKCYISIPNAFTPDGDGINDYFFPRQLLSLGITKFYMGIYSRWGEKVFEANNTNGRGWDGKLNGMIQPQGVYVYRIDVSFINGRQEKYQGNITLLR